MACRSVASDATTTHRPAYRTQTVATNSQPSTACASALTKLASCTSQIFIGSSRAIRSLCLLYLDSACHNTDLCDPVAQGAAPACLLLPPKEDPCDDYALVSSARVFSLPSGTTLVSQQQAPKPVPARWWCCGHRYFSSIDPAIQDGASVQAVASTMVKLACRWRPRIACMRAVYHRCKRRITAHLRPSPHTEHAVSSWCAEGGGRNPRLHFQ